MRKILTFLFLCLFATGTVLHAQETGKIISLNPDDTELDISHKRADGFKVKHSLSALKTLRVKTPQGFFTQLQLDGYFPSQEQLGAPALPRINKLIEIPQDAIVQVKVVSYDEEIINLADVGIKTQLFPAQPSISKSDDPDNIKFVFDKEAYQKDEFSRQAIAKVTEVGTMRGIRMGRISISPFRYNPVQNVLKVLNNIEIEVVFKNGDTEKTSFVKQKYYSPYFDGTRQMLWYEVPGTKELITAAPTKYVIVSDPAFEDALQPFIDWKKKKGFNVVEAYTDDPAVGTTTTSIKAYLQGLYDAGTVQDPAPSFVLLVGDVSEIPTFDGEASSHVTDLYYMTYDGASDQMPDLYYGRFSATSVAELQPQIDKTMEYEQFTMPDPSYLDEIVLVAGVDAGHAPTYGNGQINYGTTYYFNAAHGITPHIYLYPESGSSAADIIQNVSDGVTFGNYTAHCSPSGWGDPSFTISDISGLQNEHKYGLLVGNCCSSVEFQTDCFGEELLRAENKGAIGYIGGSNSTYWDEDYYWGVGAVAVTANPTYDANALGAYDCMFHDNGEDPADWYITQGQVVQGGNLAVTQGGTSRILYYWEIYHLMGDPSLTPYLSNPDAVTADHLPTLVVGSTSLTVSTEENAYVALTTMDGDQRVILDAAVADASGEVTLEFDALTTPGVDILDVVVTKQNRSPYTGNVTVIVPEGPYMIVNDYTIDDSNGNSNGLADYGETVNLDITLKNVGVDAANSLEASISTSDTEVNLSNSTNVSYGSIAADATGTSSGSFTVQIPEGIEDQHSVVFNVSITGTDKENYTWDQQTIRLTINAPKLTVGELSVDDSGTGNNNDGILDPGETGEVLIAVSNDGHADIADLNATLALAESTTDLVINTAESAVGALAAGATANASFNVSADAETIIGTPVNVDFAVSSGEYSAQEQKVVVIGEIPEYFMGSVSEIHTCVGLFYDSGGETGDYSSSEDYVVTFYPHENAQEGSLSRINFTEFNTESGYDYMYIYNGADETAPQIQGSPFDGGNSPGEIIGWNGDGAVTVKFTSDGGVQAPGWVAEVDCYVPTEVPACATNPAPANGATDVFPGQLTWEASNASNYLVYFGTDPEPPLVDTVDVAAYGTSLDANTTYYWRIVPKNMVGEAQGCTDVWSFTTGDPIFLMQSGNVTACEGNFYDTGGPDDDYGSSEDLVMTFMPSEDGNVLQFNFTEYETESGYDYLHVYNGTSTSAEEVDGSPFNGTTSPGTITASNPDGALTFHFDSDGSVTKLGWAASFHCIDASATPSCASNPSPASASTNVAPITTLSWDAAQNAMSYDVYIGETLPDQPTATVSSTSYAPQELSGNTTYMWKVVPKNMNGDTPESTCPTWVFTTGGAVYSMDNQTVTTCSGSFVDDGLDGNYSTDLDLVMTFESEDPSANISVTFSEFAVEPKTTGGCWDYLKVYDGNSTSADLIGTYCGYDPTIIGENGTVTATNGALTFEFSSDGSVTKAGWVASVTCVGGSNTAPVFMTEPLDTAYVGHNYSYNIEAHDDDDDALSISCLMMPNWLTDFTDNGDGTATLSGTPAAEHEGTGGNDVLLSLDDGNVYTPVQQSFCINVINDNAVPTLSADELNFKVYPNPFSDNTKVEYSLPENANVQLAVYDLLGNQVMMLVDDTMSAGSYHATLSASTLKSGMYFCRITVNGQSVTQKIIISK